MSKLQRVAIVAPKGDYNNNVLPLFARNLAQAFQAKGLETLALDSAASDFRRRLLTAALDPATAVYAGHFFYDMGLVHADEVGSHRMSLFEALDRPVFARIADHPFAEFMWSRIEEAAPTTRFLMPSGEFEAETRFLNPRLTHFHQVTPTLTVEPPADDEVKPLAERGIDLFVPCGIKPISPRMEQYLQRYRESGHRMAQVVDETVEEGLVARDRAIMDIFLEAIRRHFGARFQPASPLSEGDREILFMLSCADFKVRTFRRLNVIDSLTRLDPGLRIVITMPDALRADMPSLRERSNIELIGKVDAAEARRLYLDSRYVLNVNPTYVSLVSERVRNAMAYGCCVISDRTAHAARTYTEGEEILFLQGSDVAPLNDQLKQGLERAQAMATRARRRVLEDSTIPRLADDIAAVMEAAL
ncbi:MAG: hypothetical protein Tsb0032_08980 [Kiloniellaceae bacterium]